GRVEGDGAANDAEKPGAIISVGPRERCIGKVLCPGTQEIEREAAIVTQTPVAEICGVVGLEVHALGLQGAGVEVEEGHETRTGTGTEQDATGAAMNQVTEERPPRRPALIENVRKRQRADGAGEADV